MSGPWPWYVARGTGLVAWAALSASMLVGLSITGRLPARLGSAWKTDLHRFLGGAGCLLVAAHLVALALDEFVEFPLLAFVVPGASPWRPAAVAFGVVALWALIAVEVTSLARRRLSRRAWRLVHQASALAWVSATIHLFQAGTDVRHVPVRGVATAVTVAVVLATIGRFAAVAHRRRRSAVQPASIERSRQQLAKWPHGAVAIDQAVRPAVFPQHLPAPTAGHYRTPVGHPHGHRDQATPARRDERRHHAVLGAGGEAVARVLHVAPGHHAPIVGQTRRPDAEPAVRGVRVGGHRLCGFPQPNPVDRVAHLVAPVAAPVTAPAINSPSRSRDAAAASTTSTTRPA